MSKKHLNRIAVDMCTPTAERRPTTIEDIMEDVFIEDFDRSADLYDFLLNILNMTDEDVIEEMGHDDLLKNKIIELIAYCSDPGDGTPNILYCCVEGNEVHNIVSYDAFDDLDFDEINSETLIDILINIGDYEDDDYDDEYDDEYDEEDY